nr:MAG: peptidase S26 [Thermoproteus sp. AZ2]
MAEEWSKDLLYLAVVVFAVFFAARYILHVAWPFAVVSSWSMLPTLRVGDFVVLSGISSCNALEVGDIIVYIALPPFPPGEWIIHRVASIAPGCEITTKGDNNPISDQVYGEPPVTLDRVIGKVVFIVPYVGIFPLVVRPQSSSPAGLDLWAMRLAIFAAAIAAYYAAFRRASR